MTEQEKQLLREPFKPCPRCGASPRCSISHVSRNRKGETRDWIECSACGYETHKHITFERAALEWQVRDD